MPTTRQEFSQETIERARKAAALERSGLSLRTAMALYGIAPGTEAGLARGVFTIEDAADLFFLAGSSS